MVENTETPSPTPEAVAPVAAPEAVQAPVVPVEITPASVVETPPTVTVEAVEKAPETVPPAVTVLAEALDKDAPKPEPLKSVEETTETTAEPPKTTEGQSVDPAPPPVYESFTVPEGITLDAERLGKFTEVLSDLELTGKVPHEFAQQFGQKAVDFHVQEVQRAIEDVNKLYQTSWDRQKTEWKDSFLKDPEIGGNRFQTTVDAARNFIRTHGGTPEQQAEFRNVMETSGLGNHPAIIRLLSRASSAMEEGRPLASVKPVSTPKSKTATMYGGKTN